MSNLLSGGFGRKREKSYNPRRPPPSVHFQIKMASIIGKTRYISAISRKNRGLWTVYQLSNTKTNSLPAFFPPLIFSLCYPKADKASFIRKKTCPGKMGNPPSQVKFSERLYEKTIRFLCPSQELTSALAYTLIDSPWPSWPGWVSRRVYMEKSWLGYVGEPNSRTNLFVSHVNSSPSFVRKCWLPQGSSVRRVILLPTHKRDLRSGVWRYSVRVALMPNNFD